MAYEITFHIGNNVESQIQSSPYANMFAIWPYFRVAEERKYGLIKEEEVVLRSPIHRDKGSYETLQDIIHAGEMRMIDASFQPPNVFIPYGCKTIHVWCPSGEQLPWKVKPKGRSRIPKYNVWDKPEGRIFRGRTVKVINHD